MNKTTLRIAFAICLIGFWSGLSAGSYFSTKARGLGLKVYNTGVRGIGMGYTGIASMDSLELNHFSLTQWRRIGVTRATIGMFYQGISAELPESGKIYSSTANFSGLNIAVPIVKNKWVFGMAVTPYTEVDFKTTDLVSSDAETFRQISTFSGTITRAQFNLTWVPMPTLALAANFSYFFGTLSDQYEFSQFSNANFRETIHKVNYRFNGAGFGLGAEFTPSETIRLAGFVDLAPGVKLNVDYDSDLEIEDTAQRNYDGFPLQFGLGSAAKLSKRWQATLDYSQQDWSKTLKSDANQLDSWYVLGLGVERAATRARNSGFFDKSDLRAGLSLKQLGYQFNDSAVTEYALHLGIGMPFGNYQNRFDLAFVGGLRGDLGKNLAEERFFKLHFAISIGERWFQKNR